MASRVDESNLNDMSHERDEFARTVESDRDAALRGSGATTLLKGGQVDVYERALALVLRSLSQVKTPEGVVLIGSLPL